MKLKTKKLRNNQIKNSILDHLNTIKEIKSTDLREIRDITGYDFDLMHVLSEELADLEFLATMRTANIDGGSMLISITRKGKVFIKDGGYPSTMLQALISWITENKATIISIFALAISAFHILYNIFSDEPI